MTFQTKRSFKMPVILLVLAIMQTYVGAGLAARTDAVTNLPAAAQQLSGILTTQDNKPVTVNGASSMSGATILPGSMIETPDGVKATITIPGHGTLEISPNTRLTIQFDQNGITVNLIQGCAVLVNRKGTTGEIDNAQGVIGKTDAAKDGRIDTCPTKVAGVAAAGSGGLFGLGTAATVAIVAGGAGIVTAVALGSRGSNPSPGTP
jgi:hypothetical protein